MNLKEVSVTNRKKVKHILGVKRRCKLFCNLYNALYPGMQIGLFIKNDFQKPLKIKNVEVYVKKDGKPKAPVRLRIYKFDTINKLPGEDILLEQHIASAKKGGEWISFDLRSDNIYIPETGVVFAVEWGNAGEQYYYNRSEDEKHKQYGVVIGGSYCRKKPLTFTRNFTDGWKKVILPDNLNRYPIPDIRVHCIK